MINQKESKQFSMERLLLRDMKTKAINKLTNNIDQQLIIKNNRKV